MDAQRLAIKKQQAKLRPMEYIRMKIHMRYCSLCRNFEKFSLLVNKAFAIKINETDVNLPYKLSEAEKLEMQQKIDETSNTAGK
jgi:hypothetical protein